MAKSRHSKKQRRRLGRRIRQYKKYCDITTAEALDSLTKLDAGGDFCGYCDQIVFHSTQSCMWPVYN